MSLNDLLRELKGVLDNSENPNFTDSFHESLDQISKANDSNVISEMVLLLDDDYDFDDIMFSMIHLIETFDDEIYVERNLECVDQFYKKSPRWAVIIYIRILNSDPTFKVFLGKIKGLKKENAESLKMILAEISRDQSELGMKAELALERFNE